MTDTVVPPHLTVTGSGVTLTGVCPGDYESQKGTTHHLHPRRVKDSVLCPWVLWSGSLPHGSAERAGEKVNPNPMDSDESVVP